jgi:hypothetical protein
LYAGWDSGDVGCHSRRSLAPRRLRRNRIDAPHRLGPVA